MAGMAAAAVLSGLPALSAASEPSSTITTAPRTTTAPRLATPKNVRIEWGPRAVTVTWNAVSGARKYAVTAFGYGVIGPQLPILVAAPATGLRIPKSHLPQSPRGGFRFTVNAKAGSNWSPSAQAFAKVRNYAEKVVRQRTFTENNQSALDSAVHLAKSCAADGAAVAIGTGAVGAPFVIWSVPIPGIGEVTAGGLAAVAGVAGGSTTVACFARAAIPW